MSNKIAAVVTKIVNALESLDNAEERLRATEAALTVFGDSRTGSPTLGTARSSAKDQGEMGRVQIDGVNSAGQTWMSRNGVTKAQLEELIHIDSDGVNVLSTMGAGKRQQTINAYLLTGVAELLRTGKAEFTDKLARKNCNDLGCYDIANHNKTRNEFGNKITGSKKGGWKVTAPGLAEAATLFKSPAAPEGK
jgi:ABC-type transporter Mla MlaB component